VRTIGVIVLTSVSLLIQIVQQIVCGFGGMDCEVVIPGL
jgi:hypothetical protein